MASVTSSAGRVNMQKNYSRHNKPAPLPLTLGQETPNSSHTISSAPSRFSTLTPSQTQGRRIRRLPVPPSTTSAPSSIAAQQGAEIRSSILRPLPTTPPITAAPSTESFPRTELESSLLLYPSKPPRKRMQSVPVMTKKEQSPSMALGHTSGQRPGSPIPSTSTTRKRLLYRENGASHPIPARKRIPFNPTEHTPKHVRTCSRPPTPPPGINTLSPLLRRRASLESIDLLRNFPSQPPSVKDLEIGDSTPRPLLPHFLREGHHRMIPLSSNSFGSGEQAEARWQKLIFTDNSSKSLKVHKDMERRWSKLVYMEEPGGGRSRISKNDADFRRVADMLRCL